MIKCWDALWTLLLKETSSNQKYRKRFTILIWWVIIEFSFAEITIASFLCLYLIVWFFFVFLLVEIFVTSCRRRRSSRCIYQWAWWHQWWWRWRTISFISLVDFLSSCFSFIINFDTHICLSCLQLMFLSSFLFLRK